MTHKKTVLATIALIAVLLLPGCQMISRLHHKMILVEAAIPPTGTDAPDDIMLTPGGPAYRANVHGTGTTDLWPEIKSTDAYLGSGSSQAHISYRSLIETPAGTNRNNLVKVIIPGKTTSPGLRLYADYIPEGITLAESEQSSQPATTASVLVIGVAVDAAPGDYQLQIGLIINGKDYGTVTCTVRVTATGNPLATGVPAGAWELGERLYYSEQPIQGNTLVMLELGPIGQTTEAGHIPQSIVVYDLVTKERTQVIEPPEGDCIESPAIYGTKIVFAAVDAEIYFQSMLSSTRQSQPDWDIFIYDLETSQMQPLITKPCAQVSPRIYGDTVVWLDARHADTYEWSHYDVYTCDLKTGVERRLTSATTAEGRDLAISGNIVVWTDKRYADPPMPVIPENERNFNNEIYAYDLAAGREIRITDNPGIDRNPAIDGDNIVWVRQVEHDSARADIFLYNLKTGREIQVSKSGYAAMLCGPSIGGNVIAWADASASKGNTNNDVRDNNGPGAAAIMVYDLKAGQETQITPAGDAKVWLQPVIGGNHVVFEWDRQIGSVVYSVKIE